MAKTWNKYFDETNVEDWGTLPFHESWAHTYRDEYKKLSYDKATDAFFKSLRAITNKSSDIEKVRKAGFLLAHREYTFRWYSDNLLGCIFWIKEKKHKDYLRKYWDLVRDDYNEREKVRVLCTDNVFVCDGGVQIGTSNQITHKRALEQPEENQDKKREKIDLESEDDKLPDDAKSVRKQDLTGKAFLRLTEEKLTRKPGLYELKPSPAEEIMELIEELKEKLVKEQNKKN
ncbi:13076_t:CDS:2 [Funneliformis caledonium]|uniref:13076_t:CDS:1 n=1 Tax=Funneliformis caledonium TaxID=1117310 RepID=A0A9N9EEF3_9GLOM|nr:13076_t:CDS:2 [Funneliformis caledonium]